MIRLDPATASHVAPPTVPPWALAGGALHDVDAAFQAGAALGALDTLARAQPAWAGAWRQRLALRCAAASMRLADRAEDEAALRDAWYLRPVGADPGPAGTVFGAWRQLAAQPPAATPDRLEKVFDQLGIHLDNVALADLSKDIGDPLEAPRPAPFAAAAIAARVVAVRPDAELLAWWLADLVLAQTLRWPRPLPLLMAQAFGPAFRGEAGGKRIRPGEKGFERAVCAALVQAVGRGLPAGRRAVTPDRETPGGGVKVARQGRWRRDLFAAQRRRRLRLADHEKPVAFRDAPAVRPPAVWAVAMSQASVRRKPNEQPALLDTELEHLPPELRWREWMGRVEVVIFAASEPGPREVLARGRQKLQSRLGHRRHPRRALRPPL